MPYNADIIVVVTSLEVEWFIAMARGSHLMSSHKLFAAFFVFDFHAEEAKSPRSVRREISVPSHCTRNMTCVFLTVHRESTEIIQHLLFSFSGPRFRLLSTLDLDPFAFNRVGFGAMGIT